MGYYPVYLDLGERQCVVIGSGPEAERKVRGLLEAGAFVKVITHRVSKGLQEMEARGQIVVRRRHYEEGDLKAAFLAIAATTHDRELSERIAAEAEREGVLLNVMDITHLCTWIAPAIVRRGDLALAISTGGLSPAMARFVREELEQTLPEEFGPLLQALVEVRRGLRSRNVAPRPDQWQKVIRRELGSVLASGDWESFKRRLEACLDPDSFSEGGASLAESARQNG